MGVVLIREDGDRKILRDKIPRRVHDPLTKTKTVTPETVQDITYQVTRSSARRRYKATLLAAVAAFTAIRQRVRAAAP